MSSEGSREGRSSDSDLLVPSPSAAILHQISSLKDMLDQDENNLSTHEKESTKLRSTIEEMERANLEPKSWTMIGEDESKSKKDLAEIYEEEYAQTTMHATAPISVSDELKKEAEMLFKKICSIET